MCILIALVVSILGFVPEGWPRCVLVAGPGIEPGLSWL
ncbi:exopeptide [Sinorhizobium medicae]